MENALKRKVAGGAAGLALLAGAGGAAFAASSDDPRGPVAGDREAFIDGVAKRVGVSPEKLRDAIRAEAKEHGGFPLLGPGGPPPRGAPPPFPGPPPGRPPHAPPPPPVAAGLDAAAKYLGLTGPQFRKQLEAGKSLAEMAAARGKSVDGLKSAIEAAVKSRLDKAVADKPLPREQADQILSGLHDRLDDLVNRKPRLHRRHW